MGMNILTRKLVRQRVRTKLTDLERKVAAIRLRRPTVLIERG